MKQEFVTIARYQYSSEAQIVKGRFEAEGIPVYLSDVHTIDTDPLVSNAIGGIKVKVNARDREKALQVMEAISKYSVDDAGHEICCPQCESEKVMLLTHIRNVRSFFFFLFSLIINALPMSIKYNYHCEDCNHKFNLK